MQKKLIALAVASILAAPLAAQAGVEVYGQARMSLDFSSNDDANTNNEDSAISVSSNNSRLGFKGDEDLGGGLKLMWQIEQGLSLDTGTAFNENRNTFVGLNGGFGTVLMGKHDTPNKLASAPLDIFVDTRADFNAIVGGDVRADNVIAYISPDMTGFKVLAAYVPSRTDDTLRVSKADYAEDIISLAGIYANGPIYATLAYESLGTGVAANDDAVDIKLGGSYDLGQGTKLGALFEQVDSGVAGSDSYNIWYLNASHKMGDTTLKAAYGSADETSSIANNAATQFSLGAAQALSKTTEVYALYSMVSNDPGAAYSLKGVGGVTGQDVSSFSVGLNHTFSSK